MKSKGLLSLLVVTLGCAGLVACGSGSSDPQNVSSGVYLMTFTPGFIDSSTSGQQCTGGESELQYLSVQSSGAATGYPYTQQSDPITYYTGSFANPINQSNPCFTGQVVAPISNCSNINNNSTIQFRGCSLTNMGTYELFNATYQIYTNGIFIMQGTVRGTSGS